mgnify:CR=1 FL=1
MLKQAKWIKEERQRILEQAKQEADGVVKEAENRIISMIDEHEITRKAYEQKAEIIETANEFAAVVTGNLKDANGNIFSTQYVAFMVDENVKAFNLNNTNSTVDFSGDMTAEQVQTALKDADVEIEWKSVNPFMGKLDGNGVEVYGLKSTETNAGLIPHVAYSTTIMNLTVKNSYFLGKYASAFVALIATVGIVVSTLISFPLNTVPLL